MAAATLGPENVPNPITQADLGGLKTPQASTPTVSSPAGATPTAVSSAGSMGTVGENSYTAATQDVGQKGQSDFQANKIMSQDSPLMQLARQEGLLTAARRGLGNSSIAAGASQASMAKAAVPLAQQNAQQEYQQGLANQTATNAAASENTRLQQNTDVFNVGEANKAAGVDAAEQNKLIMQNQQIVASANELQAKMEADAAMQKHSTDADLTRTWASGEISARLASISGEYNEIIQSNASAASIMTSTNDAIASIWSNSEIPVKTKIANAESLIGWTENSLKVLGSISGMEFRTLTPTPTV